MVPYTIFKNRPEIDEKRCTLTITDEQYVKLKDSAWFLVSFGFRGSLTYIAGDARVALTTRVSPAFIIILNFY